MQIDIQRAINLPEAFNQTSPHDWPKIALHSTNSVQVKLCNKKDNTESKIDFLDYILSSRVAVNCQDCHQDAYLQW